MKEVLDFLNDYPDRAKRQEFLGNLEFIYGEDDQDWKEMRDEDKERREVLREHKKLQNMPLREKQRRQQKQVDQRIEPEE